MVERGARSLIPLPTTTDDYHSVLLMAQLYKGTAGTPLRARNIENLQSVYAPAEKTIEVASADPASDRVKAKPRRVKKAVRKKPVSKKIKNLDEVGDPIVIEAPLAKDVNVGTIKLAATE